MVDGHDAGRRDDGASIECDHSLIERHVGPAEQAVALDGGDFERRDPDVCESGDGLCGIEAGID